jgi:PPOX class probable F420-dependent enzyme
MATNQRASITLTDEEVQEFLQSARSATIASIGPTGHAHLVAMWFTVIDGDICFETKMKSQKVVNLRRNPKVSALIEDGATYEELRGVSIEGTAEVIEDAELLWRVGVDVWERYYGPYTEELKPFVDAMVNKRVVVRISGDRVRSWDHRKMGMPSTGEPSGSTMSAPGRRAR